MSEQRDTTNTVAMTLASFSMRGVRVALPVCLLALVLLFTARASAQVQKRGQAGVRFLEYPVGAEAAGRGGVGTAMLQDASAVFWNPAGLGRITSKFDVGTHHTFWIADINQTSGAAAFNAGNWGTFALSLTWTDYGTLHGTRRADTDLGYIDTGEFSPSAYAVGLGYGKAMSDRFTFGVHFKLVRQDLGDALIDANPGGNTGIGDGDIGNKSYSKLVPAVDVGAWYDFQTLGLTFGAAVQHVSPEIRYEAEQFALPFNVRFALTVNPLLLAPAGMVDRTYHDAVLAVEAWKGRDFREKLQLGLEYRFMNAFVVRGGYMFGYDERGLTLGTGIRWRQYRFDYAHQRFGVFGGINLISFAASFGE